MGGFRILMTADAVGGVWTYALELAQGLAAQGVHTTLAVLGPPPSAGQRDAAAAVPGLLLQETRLPLDWLADRPDAVEAAGASIATMARLGGVDLVHLNSPALAAGASFPVPVVGACHSCVATWWQAVRGGGLPADFRWRTALLARGYAAVDALIAPTLAFAEATAVAYRLRSRPAVVHNGRGLPAEGEAGALPQADPGGFALTAGRLWDEGKNLAALDRAAARVALPVLAAGPTHGPNGTAVALPHLQLLGNLGPAELRRWLARGPVFVSTARYEPFGLAVLEAAQAGCALVLSDIPSFRELWDGAAVFVSAEDDVAIAAAIDAVATEPGWRMKLGAAARERARRYTAERMTAGVLDIYRRLLGHVGHQAGTEAAA